MKRPRLTALAAGVLFAALSVPVSSVAAAPVELQENASYLVVLKNGVSSAAAEQLVSQAGGTITSDLTKQIGVVIAESEVVGFDAALNGSNKVELAAENLRFKGLPGSQDHPGDPVPGGGPFESADTFEALQWDMRQIRAPEAHAIQAGSRLVDVGILDSGITASHPDFTGHDGNNVDCVRGRDFVLSAGISPLGNPDPCVDNQYHGTHVAGTVAARANGIGVVGVAPNVTLVPIKVCDELGYCYASSVIEGITYSGDIQLDVINMSFYVDDNEFLGSTEFKCNNDPPQRAIRHAVERAIQYARNQGVTPVAALGNSDVDLAHPQNDRPGVTNACEVVPAETQGVIGTASTGPGQEKASYSNYGVGATDVTAPGGNAGSPYGETPGGCGVQIASTFSPTGWVCIQGTSMAAPHTAGVAALIISQYGTVGSDGDVKMPPQKVEAYLQGTTVDIGQSGYDECFGHGRIDALKAVTHDTSRVFMETPPCPEYTE
jgi:subtilisin family serine protease